MPAALLLGGAGGYTVRGMSGSTASGSQTTTHPFVVEPVPSGAQPTFDPNGFTVPI